MAGNARINVVFKANLKDFSTKMQNSQRQLKKFGRQMKRTGKSLSTYLTLPIAALGFTSVKAFDKQAKAIAQVEAGLKSTGNQVGFTSAALQKMASDLQNTTLFGDEEILKGATSQLLTFTNIAGAQFKRLQVVALDVSTRIGTDLTSASIMLGKALNDPIANLGALGRSGIQFSVSQKKVIKALASTGRLAEAQRIILKELENQYGGSAKAAADAGAGPLKQLGNILSDLSEEFGKLIFEYLKPLIAKIKKMALAFRDLSPATKKNVVAIAALAAVMGPLLIAVGFMATSIIPGLISVYGVLSATITGVVIPALSALWVIMLANPYTAIAVGLAAVVSGFFIFNKETKRTLETQNLLSKITDTATRSIVNERAKLAELLAIAKDERISKAQRISAIKKLNKLSPKYLGNLTLEKINTDDATEAVKKYNDALLETAKLKAAQDKLQAINAKIIEEELAHAKNTNLIEEKNASLLKTQGLSHEAITGLLTQQKLLVNISNAAYDKRIAKLKAEEQLILDIIKNNKINASVISGGATGRPRVSAIPGVETKTIKPFNVDNSDLETGLAETSNLVNNFGSSILINTRAMASDFAEGFGEVLGNIALGTAGIGDLFGLLLGTIGDFMIKLGASAIAISKTMLAIKAAFVVPGLGIIAGIALIALGTVMKGVASNFDSNTGGGYTPLATGGIVYGPTNALVGEYAGARSNPEVIAPLDKLKNLIGNTAGNALDIALHGEFRIKGTDLVLIVDENRKQISRRG